jgi:hypothetical protein
MECGGAGRIVEFRELAEAIAAKLGEDPAI